METVEQKILLEQITDLYHRSFANRNHPNATHRQLEIYFARNVDGRTLRDLAEEHGLSVSRIREIEMKVYRRFRTLINRYRIEGIFQ